MSHLYDSSSSRHTAQTSSPRMAYSDRSYVNSPSRSSYYTSATMNASADHASSPRSRNEASDNSPIKADVSMDHDPSSSTSAPLSSKAQTVKDENKDDKKATAKRPREQYSCVECCKYIADQASAAS